MKGLAAHTMPHDLSLRLDHARACCDFTPVWSHAACAALTVDGESLYNPDTNDEIARVVLPAYTRGRAHVTQQAEAYRVVAGELTLTTLDRADKVTDTAIVQAGTLCQLDNLSDAPVSLLAIRKRKPRAPTHDPVRISLVGAGWSGTFLAIRLLQDATTPLQITLIERADRVGLGVAYGTPDPAHRLNVPADKMSIDATDPNDFLRFAQAEDPSIEPHTLAHRQQYGRYLRDRLLRAVDTSASNLTIIRAQADKIEAHTASRWCVTLHDQPPIDSDLVVLTTGHGTLRIPSAVTPWRDDPRVIVDPTPPGALDSIETTDRVALIGTGLTAIDVLITLRARGITQPIVAVSRRGYWPFPHLPEVHWHGDPVTLALSELPETADELAAWLTDAIDRAHAAGQPWQAVIDAFKPAVAPTWARLSSDERKRFLTHHRALWEVVRHRVPHDTAAALAAWRTDGSLLCAKGGIQALSETSSAAFVLTAGNGARFEVDRLVLCTGHDADVRSHASPLWRDLLDDGLVCSDTHGLGILTDATGAVLDANGTPTGLWALGGMLRPYHFESTSVPDLARIGHKLVARLLDAATSRK